MPSSLKCQILVSHLLPRIFSTSPRFANGAIFDKHTIDEAIFRTINIRNRIMLELMARRGMRISEVLGLRPSDIDDQKLLIHDSKSGRERKIVFIPRKISRRLLDYVIAKDINSDQRIFSITYAGARKVVTKVGRNVGIKLRSHDLRRHAATYASSIRCSYLNYKQENTETR